MDDENKKQGEILNDHQEADSNETARSSKSEALTPEEDFGQLREKLELKEKEAKEHYERYLRQVAEVDNFKKRISRDKDDAIRYANEQLIRDILPVIDNLDRAIAHAQGGVNGNPLVEGVELVRKGLLDILHKHGLVPVAAVGEPFDPLKHEAMAQVESDQYEANTVVDEHHRGYVYRDRLLRPALVTVAKASTLKHNKNKSDEVENGSTDD